MKTLRRIIKLLLVMVIVIPIIAYFLTFKISGVIHDKNIDTSSLTEYSHSHKDGIKNILIMGSDARPGDKVSRSDSLMIMSIDSIHDDVKITSLARDTLVNIDDHGKTKLTHAYAFGKEKLLIKTVEDNFDIDIDDFVAIDFKSFMAIIDAVGGVTVEVKDHDINELNKFIPETYSWDTRQDKGDMQLVKSSGIQKLNGYQALSFARIRHNDSAFGRDNRQRMILSSLMKELKATSKFKYLSILKTAAPYITTNMDTMKLIKYGLSIMTKDISNIKQMEFPLVDNPRYTTSGIYGSHGWVIRFDPTSVSFLKDFIYNDIDYKN